jgi:hypothetical protein
VFGIILLIGAGTIGKSWILGIICLALSILGSGFGYLFSNTMETMLRNKNKVRDAQALAATKDPSWNPNELEAYIKIVFLQYQQNWSDLNSQQFPHYTTQLFATRSTLLMQALAQLGRKNLVKAPEIFSMAVDDLVDSEDNKKDTVCYRIAAKATDQIVDTRTGKILFEDHSTFMEYWNFVRGPKGVWLVDSIKQSTETSGSISKPIKQFAEIEGLVYSPDMGWLLLPTVGDIFSEGDFGKSDINNHCIGTYHDILVQLYSYIPKKDNNGNPTAIYTVAQVAVPHKNYGRIVVRRKPAVIASFFTRKPKGTEKIETESLEFNKLYDVYAAGYEGSTSFELLHPTYIEKLTALPFVVELEVYDNTVFIYTKDKNADYVIMFELLKAAFAEMKL